MLFTPVAIVLVAISIVGALAIPFGDPQFLDRAVALELSFITLAIVILLDIRRTVKKVPVSKLAVCVCIPLAITIIVGNSLAPPHIEIMTTFSKPLNALLLITGGYILQAALIGTSVMALARNRVFIVQKQKN